MYWLLSEEKQKKVRELVDQVVLALSDIPHKPPHTDQIFPFQGRKAINHAKTVINILTDVDAVVCDPFVGSGSFGYASVLLGRHTLVNEYEPYTYRMMSAPYDLPERYELEVAFKQVIPLLQSITDYYYRTICTCGHSIVSDSYFYDREPKRYLNITHHERLGPNGQNVTFRGAYRCKNCGNETKFFNDFDKLVLDKLEEENNDFFNIKLIENSRINLSKEFVLYGSLFPKRSRIVSFKMWNALVSSNIPMKSKVFLENVFLSIIPSLKYKDYRSKSQDLHCPKIMLRENNPFNLFVKQYKKRRDTLYKYNESFSGTINLSCKDFRVFMKEQAEESVNIVITDPPWHDGSAYFERAQLYHPWIGFNLKNDEERLANEVIVSDSPERPDKKNYDRWWNDIDDLFRQSYRILKAESFLVLYFRPVPATKWISNFNRLKLLARKNGFEPLLTIDLSNNDPSMRIQQSAHYAFSSDLILTFLRLSPDEKRYYVNDLDLDELGFRAAVILQDRLVRSFTKHEWWNEIFESLRKEGLVELHLPKNRYVIERIFSRVCEKRNDGTYLPKATTPYSDEIFNVPYIERVSLYVPYVIEELLNKSDKFTFDQFLLKIAEFVENGTRAIIEDILGDGEDNIASLLELYAEPIDGGKYFTKRPVPKIPENIANLLELNPIEFENLVAKLLELEGYKNVAVSGRSGDRGVDIRCHDEEGNLVIVQCKRYTKSKIGSTPIQRLHSFGVTRGASKMICITTTDYTPDGYDEARLTNVELIERTKLESLVYKHNLFNNN
ncbi:hypothetical protein AM629_00860 [Photorhabdus heterorhabditis]|uniref:Restriction endonuclease type IV Mrr domain-containing protein n=1 Tax=Photorhabdus heterorhabditis TaxID=880156 RepID=A0ABR5KHH2_9GAMM|nr:restriction endonuclease [Photorhabdus heterorhabditis]KOY64015.1 hypothetical protein AM629_00860 [Photorhabdus heterorhabditis]